MAIDFSQVKKIEIPEGEIKEVKDSTGEIVLWTGSHTITVNAPYCDVVGAGEYDDGYSYTVTVTCQGQRYINSATSGGSLSNDISVHVDSQGASTQYQTVTYTGTLTDDITINVTTEQYFVISFINSYDSSQNQYGNWISGLTPAYSGTPTRDPDAEASYVFDD